MADNFFDQFDQPEQKSGGGNFFDKFDAQKPASNQQSIGHELLVQPVEGLYSALDATYNLPNNALNWAARQLGYDEPVAKPQKLFTRFSTGEEPTTAVGRYARSIGEQAGAMAIPYAGGVARAAMGPATTMLGKAASIPATAEAAGQHAISAVGAGIGSQAAKDMGYDETGQMIGALAGGVGGPTAYNLAAKPAGLATNAIRYGTRVTNEAFRPDLAADRDAIEAMRRSGTSPQEIRDAMLKSPQASTLKDYGLSDQQISQVIARQINGEAPADIANELAAYRNPQGQAVTPQDIDLAHQDWKRANPTPMSPMDIAEELGAQKGKPGAAIPMVRAARGAQNISAEVGPGMDLLRRQREQGARLVQLIDREVPTAGYQGNVLQRVKDSVTNFIDSLYPASSYEKNKVTWAKQARAQAASDYRNLHAQDAIPIDEELADLLTDPSGSAAYSLAMKMARADGNPIPTRQELLKTYGINPNPGLGLNREGVPVAPTQYPEGAPGAHGATITPRALDYFARALRQRSANYANPNSPVYSSLRRRLIDHLDPENPVSTDETLLPNYRATMQRYRSNMADQEALEAAASLKPALNEKTYDALAEFDNMNPAQKELFRMRLARSVQDGIKTNGNKDDPFAQFDTDAFRYIIGRVYEPTTAQNLINTLDYARATSQAEGLGERLAKNASSTLLNDPDVQAFRAMDARQQELARHGFFREIRSKAGRPEVGRDVASQFNNPNSLALIREMLPSEASANAFLRDLNREDISTTIKGGLYGQSTTAQQIHDASGLQQASRAAADIGLARWKSFLRDIRDEVTRQFGERRAGKLLRQLAEIDPGQNLQNLDRQIDLITRGKEGLAGRDLKMIIRQKARNYWPAKAVMAGQIPLDLQKDAERHQEEEPHRASGGKVTHEQTLKTLEHSPLSPAQKARIRRKIIESAIREP